MPLLGELGSKVTDLTGISGAGLGSTMGKWALIFLVIFIVGTIAAVVTYYIVQSFKLNKKIVLFEKVNGRYQNTKKYKGMLQKKDNTYVLIIPSLKRIEPKPHTQVGPNTYWYFIDDNGDWVNFGMGDLHKQRMEVVPEVLDLELAYARSSLDYDRKERYEKVSWLKEHWSLLVSIGVIIVILVFLFLIVQKIMASVGTLDAVSKTNKEVLEALKGILGATDNIKNGGSGLSPAT